MKNKFELISKLAFGLKGVYLGLDCKTPIRCRAAVPAFILWAPDKKSVKKSVFTTIILNAECARRDCLAPFF